MEQIISVCGDRCSECPRYIATIHNDPQELHQIANLWFRLGLRDTIVSNDDISCHGCNRTKACSFGLTSCPGLVQLNNCGECSSFPCTKINDTFSKTDEKDALCKSRCSEAEYAILKNAFFLKREILNQIHQEMFNRDCSQK